MPHFVLANRHRLIPSTVSAAIFWLQGHICPMAQPLSCTALSQQVFCTRVFQLSYKRPGLGAIFQSDLNFHLLSEILPAESLTKEMCFQEMQSLQLT